MAKVKSCSVVKLKGHPNTPARSSNAELPVIRVPMRTKITLPYAVLALIFAVAAAYIVSEVALESIEERFTNQLIEVGKLTADQMVLEEKRLLETLRLVANTEGLAASLEDRDAEHLRELVLPVAANSREEAIEILDLSGTTVLAMYHREGGRLEEYSFTRGDNTAAMWPFARNVLNGKTDVGGDKYAGVGRTARGNYFFVAAPVKDGNRAVGALLVGKSLKTLTGQIRQETLAHATIYGRDGELLASTLPAADAEDVRLDAGHVAEVMARQAKESPVRSLQLSIQYTEILGPWEVRGGEDQGVIGAALAQTFLVRPSSITRVQIVVFVAVAFLAVIATGLFLANRITHPLLGVVHASAEVARGNLDVQVRAAGNDEVAFLAQSFNKMVSGLREGSIYRDLLGRAVSAEVREQLRHSLASGDLRLEGQATVASVLMADIRGFTTLSEQVDSATILEWLNEYFEQLVPIIAAHQGVVNKFDGDAVLAFWGILPQRLAPEESAYLACKTAVEMIKHIEMLNARRAVRRNPPFVTGIGVNTGLVTAGSLGAADRLHYTIIGDTVNTTQRIESVTREFGETGAIISQHTYEALGEHRHEFTMLPIGVRPLKGKSEQVELYRLLPVPQVSPCMKGALGCQSLHQEATPQLANAS